MALAERGALREFNVIWKSGGTGGAPADAARRSRRGACGTSRSRCKPRSTDGHEEERKAQRAATTGAQHRKRWESGERLVSNGGPETRMVPSHHTIATEVTKHTSAATRYLPREKRVARAGCVCTFPSSPRSRRSTAAVCPQSASALPSPQPLRSARCPDAQTARTSLVRASRPREHSSAACSA